MLWWASITPGCGGSPNTRPRATRRMRKGGKGGRYAQMLARELKPFIRSGVCRTKRAAVGCWRWVAHLWAGWPRWRPALLYPRVFGTLAVMSPSVWWDQRSILEKWCALSGLGAASYLARHGDRRGRSPPQQSLEDARLLRDALGKGLARWRRSQLPRIYRRRPQRGGMGRAVWRSAAVFLCEALTE